MLFDEPTSVLFLDGGIIVERGTPGEVLTRLRTERGGGRPYGRA